MTEELKENEAPYKRQRVKTGCLPCRQRRKKCDERRPVCTGCTRNHLLCAWSLDARLKHRTTDIATSTSPATRNSCSIGVPSAGQSQPLCSKFHTRQMQHRNRSSSVPPNPSLWAGRIVNTEDQRLFQHYVEITSKRLIATEDVDNRFNSSLLSLAHSENAILHGLIALGASHLSFKQQSVAINARSHYAICLRAAKYEITRVVSGSHDRVMPLFALLMILCFFENLDGNATGAVSSHLRAATAVLPTFRVAVRPENEELHMLFLEMYLYFSFVADNLGLSATPEPQSELVDDSLVASISYRVQQSHGQSLMAGQSFRLFELIPKVTAFAERRPKTLPRHEDWDLKCEFSVLEAQILEWEARRPSVDTSTIDWRGFNAEVNAGLLVQCALLIFLRAALCGPSMPPDHVLEQIEALVEDFMRVSKALALAAKPRNSMLWPDLIVGSCVVKEEHRAHLEHCLMHSHFEMHCTVSAAKLLRLMWDEDGFGTCLFGPYGLRSVAEKYDMYLSLG